MIRVPKWESNNTLTHRRQFFGHISASIWWPLSKLILGEMQSPLLRLANNLRRGAGASREKEHPHKREGLFASLRVSVISLRSVGTLFSLWSTRKQR